MKVHPAVLLCTLFLPSTLAIGQKLPPSCGDPHVFLNVKTSRTAPAISADPSTATLIFVQRNSHCLGCSIVQIGIDGAWVGGNKGDSWFATTIAPGPRHICAYWRGSPMRISEDPHWLESRLWLTDMQAQTGQTSYYEVVVIADTDTSGFMVRLEPISPDEAKFLIAGSSLATSLPKTP
jgi:hypothetical protein